MASASSDLEKTAKKVASNVTHIGDVIPENVKTAARETVEQVSEHAGELMETARDFADKNLGVAKKWVKANPVAAIAAGIGLGFVLGAILRGRD